MHVHTSQELFTAPSVPRHCRDKLVVVDHVVAGAIKGGEDALKVRYLESQRLHGQAELGQGHAAHAVAVDQLERAKQRARRRAALEGPLVELVEQALTEAANRAANLLFVIPLRHRELLLDHAHKYVVAVDCSADVREVAEEALFVDHCAVARDAGQVGQRRLGDVGRAVGPHRHGGGALDGCVVEYVYGVDPARRSGNLLRGCPSFCHDVMTPLVERAAQPGHELHVVEAAVPGLVEHAEQGVHRVAANEHAELGERLLELALGELVVLRRAIDRVEHAA
mmetsp:Transcript_15905/g.40196  ORF Transcript_15905/g.40196 Transcript_15905/m.40196 type:complete len:281 (-) Transcript_15905:361-1203(-)